MFNRAPPRIIAGLSRPQWVAAERAVGASQQAAEQRASFLFDSPVDVQLVPFSEMVRIAGANRTIARHVLEASRETLIEAMARTPVADIPSDVIDDLANEAEVTLRELERLAKPSG